MGDNSNIEWTDASWNPIAAFVEDPDGGFTFEDAPGVKWRRGWFCTRVSEGCRHCYAERMNLWRGNGLQYKPSNLPFVRFEFVALDQPLHWSRPRMVFVCSMTDLFADFYIDEQIDRVFAVMALARRHTFQVLTKRSARMREYMRHAEREARWMDALAGVIVEYGYRGPAPVLRQREPWLPLPNVWLGVSIEDQKNADSRVPDLLATPAAVRWVSVEPLLGPVDLTAIRRTRAEGFMRPLDGRFNTIDWVVAGGESGKDARPMHPDWARGLRDQCVAAGVKYFFKQWGEWRPTFDGGDDGAACAVCGCTEFQACAGGCSWSSRSLDMRDVCTRCDRVTILRFGRDDFARVGKDRAGRLLDGRTWDEMPEVAR